MRLSSTCCTACAVYHDDGGVRASWMGLLAHGHRSTAPWLPVHCAPPVNGGVESEHDALVVLSCRAHPAAAHCSCGAQHRRSLIMASVYDRASKHPA
jgi:hypothetical protein